MQNMARRKCSPSLCLLRLVAPLQQKSLRVVSEAIFIYHYQEGVHSLCRVEAIGLYKLLIHISPLPPENTKSRSSTTPKMT